MPMKRKLERRNLAALLVGLIRLVHQARRKPGDRGLAGTVEARLIACVVFMGHVDKKPRTVGYISRNLGIPRATVQRKLNDMATAGLIRKHVKGTYCMGREADALDLSYIDKSHALIRSLNFPP